MATTKTELLNNGIVVATKLAAPFYSWDWIPSGTGAAVLTYKRYEDDVLVYTSGVINGTVSAGAYSADSSAVFARMATPPPTSYKNAMATFVDKLVTDGVWNKIDELQCPALDTSANALKGWKGVVNATTNGVHTPKVGVSYNGVDQFTNSGFIPATHGTNYVLTNSFVSSYIVSGTYPTSALGSIFGALPASTGERTNFQWNKTSTGWLLYRMSANTFGQYTTLSQPTDNRNYMVSRSSDNIYLFEGATQLHSIGTPPTALAGIALFEGCVNSNGTASEFSSFSSFLRVYGGGLTATDITNLNTAINSFKTAINAIV